MSQLLSDLETLFKPVLEQDGLELVDLTYQKEPTGWTLTVYLDKPGGFGLADCETWSRRLETLLDEQPLIEHSYNLEVSSPGLYRPLKKTADFQRFSGERVHAKLFSPINGQKNFHGVLMGADEENIQIRTEDAGEIVLPRSQVAKVQLDPIIKF